MARDIQIARKATGIKITSGSLNRERLLNENQVGYRERLDLVPNTLTPSHLKSILQRSTNGDLRELHETFDKLETDIDVGGHKQVVTSTLGRGVLKLEERMGFTAQERTLAKDYWNFGCLIIESLKNKHRNLIKEFASGYMRGTKVFQMQYNVQKVGSKRLAIPTSIKPIPGQRYYWECDVTNRKNYGELKIGTTEVPQGVFISNMHPGKVFAITDGHGIGRYDLLGVYRRALSFWLLKLYVMGWWGDRVEIFGEPVRVARYPQGTKEGVKSEIEQFLAYMGRTAYAMLPDNVNLQMLEAASSANGGLSVHGEIVRYLDNKIAFTFLGQSDTSSNPSHTSRARTDSLMNISWDVLQDYAAGVGDAFSQMLRSAIIMNYGSVVEHLIPYARLLVHNPTLVERNATRLTGLIKNGVPVAVDDMYEQSGAHKPSKGQLVFTSTGIQEFDESPSETDGNQETSSIQQESSGNGGESDDSGNDQKENSGR